MTLVVAGLSYSSLSSALVTGILHVIGALTNLQKGECWYSDVEKGHDVVLNTFGGNPDGLKLTVCQC
jgi:hypothetical protein